MSQPPYPGQYPEQPQSGPPYPGQPYQGQPYQGQPNPDVPSSVPPQPGFPPPAYGQQPSYGQPPPGYGQPPGYPIYGQPVPPPPPRKSRAVPITLISIALVLVLCVGGGTAAFLLVRNTTETITENLESAAPTPDATTEPTAEATPTEPPKTITIVEPKTLGGRPKLTQKSLEAGTKQMEKELAQLPGATNSVGAFYGVVAKRNMVFMAAVEAPIPDPEEQLEDSFSSSFGGLKLSNVVDVEPGPLGGRARCGDAKLSGEKVAVCAWADEGSGGWMGWYFKTVKQIRGEFAKLRGEIEKSS